MSNEIDLYDGGDIQPYNPGMPVLAPLSPEFDQWSGSDVDQLTQRDSQPQQSMLWGSALPPGTSPRQVQAVLTQMASVFESDLKSLKYPDYLVQSAITFLLAEATNPPRQVTPRHKFSLPAAEASDWLAVAFCNYLQGLSGTQSQKQQFLNAALSWLALLNKKLGTQQETRLPRTATPTSDPTANLTDAQFEALVKHNDNVKAQTETTLRRRWGSAYTLNMRLAQDQLSKLTPAEIERLDQWTGDFPWTKMLNTETAILFLFDSAIGAGTLPKNGAAIAAEIKECESVMKNQRQLWLKSDDIQARYRELLRMRDGN